MDDDRGPRNKNLYYEMKESSSALADEGLQKILEHWETIFGTSSEYVEELTTEFKTQIKVFWEQQTAKLAEAEEEILSRINAAGAEAVLLEKALGLDPKVSELPENGPLVQIEGQVMALLESYHELKNERLKIYFQLQKREQELCSTLSVEAPKYQLKAPSDENENGNILVGEACYVPTSDDLAEFKERIKDLEDQKDQLEYDFEEAKSQLRQLLEECEIVPLAKEERFVFDKAELPATKTNLIYLTESVARYRQKKEEMMAQAQDLRDQIERLSRKMFKDPNQLEQFLSVHSGFTEATVSELKKKLKSLKEERKQNLTELIANSRIALCEWWDRCCFSEAQRKEFTPYYTSRKTEEVLEFHELEIEHLEHFYNTYKKIFVLAGKHEELWERLLHLEDQSNNKDRLFNNRGGCLLQEEKERKMIQKKVPAIKAELAALLDAYKQETGKEFLHYGEPLLQKIEMKEQLRELSKTQERLQRKNANTENVLIESRLGARPVRGIKRKGVQLQDNNKLKTMRTETTTISSASKSTLSSKSTPSSANIGTVVQRAKPVVTQSYLTVHTPASRRPPRVPAASTPQNGSLSYESFQEQIEKSKYLAHNSTKNVEHQTALRPKNLNQTRTVTAENTPYRTPKTPGRTFTKTPTKTPSRIPFRIPTGSKIPSQVPPVSPRKPVLSKTKLPIIF